MDHFGYAGNILWVDLTTREIKKEPLNTDLISKYIGGWGINLKLAYDLMKPQTDPLKSDNPIIIGIGPLVGTLAPSASKISATTKFALPATGDGLHYITTASSGSRRFGIMLKNAGYDHVVVTGRAEMPAYLKIIDDDVEICDASELWGKMDIYETTNEMLTLYGNCGVVAIGMAGENMVRYAMAVTDRSSTLGRSGFGAVMGSKNLKAIVTKGSLGLKIHDQRRFMNVVDSMYQNFAKRMKPYSDPIGQGAWKTIGLPNFDPGVWSKADWDARYGVEKWNQLKRSPESCSSCWLACKPTAQITSGRFCGVAVETGHFSQVQVVGQRLELVDYQESMKLLEIINKAGICAQTSSSLIDWITRLYERDVITQRDTGGMVLRRDLNTYLALVTQIVNRQGIGNALAEGWFETSHLVGLDARSDYVQGFGIAKGTDCIYPAQAARLAPQRFIMGMTCPRGGHSSDGHSATVMNMVPLKSIKKDAERWCTPQESLERIFTPLSYYGDFNAARLASHIEDAHRIMDCLGVCSSWAVFRLIDAATLAELYSAATGRETTPYQLKVIGERVQNIYKILNVREGFSRQHDSFPESWLEPRRSPDGLQHLTDYYGMHNITGDDLHSLLDDYYDERGWSIDSGIPTREKLIELELEELLDGIPEF